MMTNSSPARRRVPTRRIAAAATALSLALALGVVGAQQAPASSGGSLTTTPVNVVVSPMSANGTTSGQLSGLVDLPVLLGDVGHYELAGLSAPEGDATGNSQTSAILPAGTIDGVITDPEDGDVDDDLGRGVSITGGSESIRRTPSGLESVTEVLGVVLDLGELQDDVAAVLEITDIATAEQVVTRAFAHVDGTTTVDTTVVGLTLLGEAIDLVDGALPAPVTRARTVQSDDVVALLRSLGIDEDDIAQYAGLVSSSSLNGSFTLTASTPAEGGLLVRAQLQLTVQASLILGLGGANLSADDEVISARIGGVSLATPSAIPPRGATLLVESAEPGDTVGVTGTGFVVGGTTVTVGGTQAADVAVQADGSSLTFVVPELGGGNYTVEVTTVGGAVQADRLRVIGEDTVPLSVTGVDPATSADGAQVTVTGTGFLAEDVSIVITDSDGTAFALPTERISVVESGQSLSFRLPENLALGTATITVNQPGEQAATTLEVVQRVLDPVPATGSGNVIGVDASTFTVPLTIDNSSVMTWSDPLLINPAGPGCRHRFRVAAARALGRLLRCR